MSCLAAGFALAAVFIALNVVLLTMDGIRVGADSPAYLSAADALLKGDGFGGRPGFWPGYSAVIAFCRVLGLGLPGVVGVQLGVAALAATALYSLGKDLCGRPAGLVAAALLVGNPDIARWHAYILTDSLYTSCVILAAWAIQRAVQRRGAWYPAAATAVLCAAVMRPNGWLLPPIALAYGLSPYVRRPWSRRLVIVGIACAFAASLVALPAVRSAIAFEDPGAFLRRGEVVSYYRGWIVPMPVEPAAETPGLRSTLAYAARHPGPALALAVCRVGAELLHVRPFYALRHNAVVLPFVLLVYALAGAGYLRLRLYPASNLLLAVIVSHLLVVALVGADWDGRYLLFVFPLIGVFAGCEVAGRFGGALRSA